MLRFSSTWHVAWRKKNSKIHINQPGKMTVGCVKVIIFYGKRIWLFSPFLPLAVRNTEFDWQVNWTKDYLRDSCWVRVSHRCIAARRWSHSSEKRLFSLWVLSPLTSVACGFHVSWCWDSELQNRMASLSTELTSKLWNTYFLFCLVGEQGGSLP